MAINGCLNIPKYTEINGAKKYARILVQMKNIGEKLYENNSKTNIN